MSGFFFKPLLIHHDFSDRTAALKVSILLPPQTPDVLKRKRSEEDITFTPRIRRHNMSRQDSISSGEDPQANLFTTAAPTTPTPLARIGGPSAQTTAQAQASTQEGDALITTLPGTPTPPSTESTFNDHQTDSDETNAPAEESKSKEKKKEDPSTTLRRQSSKNLESLGAQAAFDKLPPKDKHRFSLSCSRAERLFQSSRYILNPLYVGCPFCAQRVTLSVLSQLTMQSLQRHPTSHRKLAPTAVDEVRKAISGWDINKGLEHDMEVRDETLEMFVIPNKEDEEHRVVFYPELQCMLGDFCHIRCGFRS